MKPKTKTISFILLSFVLGLMCGLFVDGRIGDRFFHRQGKSPRDFQKMLVERLKLDERQTTQLDSLLESRKKLMNERRKHMLAMRDSLQMEIKKILNTDQAKKFDEMNQEMNKHEDKKWERGGEKQ